MFGNMKNKVILMLDGHTTQTKNFNAIIYAQEHGIVMVLLLVLTPHKFKVSIQLLYKEKRKVYSSKPRKMPNKISSVQTFLKSIFSNSTIGTINRFRKTGVFLLNAIIFEIS